MRSITGLRHAGTIIRGLIASVVLAACLGLLVLGGPGKPGGDHNHINPLPLAATVAAAPTLVRTGWTATASSAETTGENAPASNVLDGNDATIWHSNWSTGTPALPQSITLDMKVAQTVSSLVYRPRQDKDANGIIGQYQVSLSLDGTTWNAPVATGTWANDRTDKTAAFATATARYIRLTAVTEAGGRGPWASAAELNVLGDPNPAPTAAPTAAPTTAAPTAPAVPAGATPAILARTGWTATASSAESASESTPAANVLDGSTATIWHSNWSTGTPALPQSVTLDMKATYAVSSLVYTPRQDKDINGNIGQYQVSVSADGTVWGTPVATGVWADTRADKTATFAAVNARYIRLTSVTEAGARGPWASAAEVNVSGVVAGGTTTPTAAPTTVAPTTVAPTVPAGTTPAILARTGWTATASSAETVGETAPASNVLDGDDATIWHSVWSTGTPALPQSVTLDMKATYSVSSLVYKPRQDASLNGNIGQYQISVSTDGTAWGTPVATGTFADTKVDKTVAFTAVNARYIRLSAVTEAGARGPWVSAAEINVIGAAAGTSTPPTGLPTATGAAIPDNTVIIPRTGWTAAADSAETIGENGAAANVLDGDGATIWHTRYTAPADHTFPHTLTIDTKGATTIAGLNYLPRVDSPNGHIGQYQVALSNDGTNFTAPVATGTWGDNFVEHSVTFKPYVARYIRLSALSEAGDRENISSAAEINLLAPAAALTSDPSKVGRWGPMIGFPLVPVAAALLPNNKMLVWSAQWENEFKGGTGKTETAILDLSTGAVSEKLVENTDHDMFCPGVAILPDGRIMVTGGNNSARTSIYNPATDTWANGPDMQIGRGYQGQSLLADGSVFTIGGGWSGPGGDKGAEVWTAAGGWRTLTGISSYPMVTADTAGLYRADNHAWLFPVTGGRTLQAGPSKAMNWISTAGVGSITPAGDRGTADAMNGNAVMYDTDKILALGGSPNYENLAGSNKAYTIDASGATAKVAATGDLAYGRGLNNSVVLPDGSVVTTGGQSPLVLFSDANSMLAAEMWNPKTGRFTTMASEARPRNYHSVSLLLQDGRVFSGGGGLCGNCTTNHPDGQIFTPPYLLNADGSLKTRPVLTGTPAKAAPGATITVKTNKAVTSFALVRYGESTHSVDNDQRRISLPIATSTGNSYSLKIPTDRGAVLPGPYMLFAMDANGVPSVSQTVTIN